MHAWIIRRPEETAEICLGWRFRAHHHAVT
jgi:hypothetical protein